MRSLQLTRNHKWVTIGHVQGSGVAEGASPYLQDTRIGSAEAGEKGTGDAPADTISSEGAGDHPRPPDSLGQDLRQAYASSSPGKSSRSHLHRGPAEAEDKGTVREKASAVEQLS